MFVNISRNKLLINSPMQRSRKPAQTTAQCNHCGGLLKLSGEMMSCIMCSREINHICSACSHVTKRSLPEKNKKSA